MGKKVGSNERRSVGLRVGNISTGFVTKVGKNVGPGEVSVNVGSKVGDDVVGLSEVSIDVNSEVGNNVG